MSSIPFKNAMRLELRLHSDEIGLEVPGKALTHAGVFHADDVFAAALLTIINPSIVIERSNDVPADYDGLVFDIGGGPFDHHGGELRYRDNGIPYAAFGLLWEQYGTLLLCEEDAWIFDEQLVQPIDLSDNAGEPNPLSQSVSDFNPAQASDAAGFDEAFSQAVAFARGIVERRIAQLSAERSDREEVLRLMRQGDGKVLVLPHVMHWRRTVVGSSYVTVVYPSLRGGFNVQCVPERLEGKKTVVSAPESWRGLPQDRLRRVSGEGDLVFCHHTGYLCMTQTLEGALRIAQLLAESNDTN